MNTAVIGLNHTTAPAEIREKVSFPDSKKIEAINRLLDEEIREVVIVSTCSRSEIYIADRERDIDEKIDQVKNFFEKFFEEKNIKEHLYFKKGKEAVFHLYSVSAGLNSIVLGEDQILGQVRDAHALSIDIGGSKKILNTLFRDAVSSSKKIKRELKISEHPISLSYIGVKFLKEKLGSLEDKTITLTGLGKMGKLALNYLVEEAPKKIYIANRSIEKIKYLEEKYDFIEIVDFEKRYECIEKSDVLISSTAASHTIIRESQMNNIKKNLSILDLSLPRDVEAKVGEIENINLYVIDDLKDISKQNEKRRKELSKKAKEMATEEVEEFQKWMKTVKIDKVIKGINETIEEIHDDTMDYINRKLDLGHKEKSIIEKMLKSSLKRIVRNPVLGLKDIEDERKREEYTKVVEELFCIGD